MRTNVVQRISAMGGLSFAEMPLMYNHYFDRADVGEQSNRRTWINHGDPGCSGSWKCVESDSEVRRV